jgi:hypothetical protein
MITTTTPSRDEFKRRWHDFVARLWMIFFGAW